MECARRYGTRGALGALDAKPAPGHRRRPVVVDPAAHWREDEDWIERRSWTSWGGVKRGADAERDDAGAGDSGAGECDAGPGSGRAQCGVAEHRARSGRRSDHRAVGGQCLPAGLRDDDRHRGAAGRRDRAAAGVPHWGRGLCRHVAIGRVCAERLLADCVAGAYGRGQRVDAPGHHGYGIRRGLARAGGDGRRHHRRRVRGGHGGGADRRRRSHRVSRLALDPVRQCPEPCW